MNILSSPAVLLHHNITVQVGRKPDTLLCLFAPSGRSDLQIFTVLPTHGKVGEIPTRGESHGATRTDRLYFYICTFGHCPYVGKLLYNR